MQGSVIYKSVPVDTIKWEKSTYFTQSIIETYEENDYARYFLKADLARRPKQLGRSRNKLRFLLEKMIVAYYEKPICD